MGRDARLKQVGKFNVCISLIFLSPQGFAKEMINCKTWTHAGQFLAMDLFDGTLRVINLNMYHGFTISSIDPDEMTRLEEMN